MMMKYTPIFLETFECELEEILEYLMKISSNKSVIRLLDSISNAIDNILYFPYLGVIYNSKISKYEVRKLNADNYVLLYVVNEKQNRIYFFRIINSR